MRFKIGDSVRVKKDVTCPDNKSLRMDGWQGRIFEIDETIGIRWDSLTLKQLPAEYIRQSEEGGFDWAEMFLDSDEIEHALPRDSEEDADSVREQMESKFFWLGEGKEGERILKVIGDADDEIGAWNKYLIQSLTFPFDARVSEPQDEGPLNQGDNVEILSIAESDDLYGVLVNVQYGRKRLVFPLCDLNARDRQSPNYTPVKDYCVWFANR